MSDLENDYNFKRLSIESDKTWDDVINRFINVMVKRGAKTSREDMEWLLLNYYALPNSPALLSSKQKKFYASACSSYPIQDSMDKGNFNILDVLKQSSMASKAGIGTGYNFSNLRSKDETVSDVGKATGGPVSFLKAYSGFGREITQNMRQKASMGLLNINHPDILDFISVKSVDGNLPDFNLSVILTDKFMKAVKNDEDFFLPYIKDKGGVTVQAAKLFEVMAKSIWDNGEPGVFFAEHITNDYFEEMLVNEILANPCSEAILSSGVDWLELCVLGSINTPKYAKLSLKDKERVVDILVRMLNDIIDVQDYVLEYHRIGMQDRNRKIGIGIAGFATQLAIDGIKYSSTEAETASKDLFAEIGKFAEKSSKKLGTVRDLDRYNASLLSVAPTSTLSNIFDYVNEEGCSYGIEPYFSIAPVIVKNSYGEFKKLSKISEFLKDKTQHIECANDLTYKEHLGPIKGYYNSNKKGIVQGCSKTINFKNNVTVEDVKEAIFYCWENNIKAISFYRDGSRKNQVISTEESFSGDANTCKRPTELSCDIHHVQSGKQQWVVFISLNDERPFEVFAGLQESIKLSNKHKEGKIIKKSKNNYQLKLEDGTLINNFNKVFQDEYVTTTRLISMSLRHNIPLKYITDQLAKDGNITAINKGISRVLKKYITDGESSAKACHSCNGKMTYVSGCLTCIDCGMGFCG